MQKMSSSIHASKAFQRNQRSANRNYGLCFTITVRRRHRLSPCKQNFFTRFRHNHNINYECTHTPVFAMAWRMQHKPCCNIDCRHATTDLCTAEVHWFATPRIRFTTEFHTANSCILLQWTYSTCADNNIRHSRLA